MDEMFKGKIKHTIQKIKDEINGVDNVVWQSFVLTKKQNFATQ